MCGCAAAAVVDLIQTKRFSESRTAIATSSTLLNTSCFIVFLLPLTILRLQWRSSVRIFPEHFTTPRSCHPGIAVSDGPRHYHPNPYPKCFSDGTNDNPVGLFLGTTPIVPLINTIWCT